MISLHHEKQNRIDMCNRRGEITRIDEIEEGGRICVNEIE